MLTDTERKILSMIRKNHGVSRKDIAECLNLSKPTVSVLVSRLMEKGFVRETGILKIENKKAGRYPVKLEFVPDALYIAGVDLGGSKLEAILSDLNGHIIKSHRSRLKVGSARKLLVTLENTIESLIDGIDTDKLLGIGVGIAGTVDKRTCVVKSFPAFNITNWNLKDPLEHRFGVRTLLANDVTLDALAEYKMGAGKGAGSLLLISIGTGIGAGMILEGHVYEGFHGQAGEIGWFVTDWTSEKKKEKTLFGPLEKWCSGYWLEKRFQKLARGGKLKKKLVDLLRKKNEDGKTVGYKLDFMFDATEDNVPGLLNMLITLKMIPGFTAEEIFKTLISNGQKAGLLKWIAQENWKIAVYRWLPLLEKFNMGLDSKDENGWDLACHVVMQNNINLLKALIQKDVFLSYSYKDKTNVTQQTDTNQANTVRTHAQRTHVEPVNVVQKFYLLHIAVDAAQPEMVKLLLSNDYVDLIEVMNASYKNLTPLSLAIRGCQKDEDGDVKNKHALENIKVLFEKCRKKEYFTKKTLKDALLDAIDVVSKDDSQIARDVFSFIVKNIDVKKICPDFLHSAIGKNISYKMFKKLVDLCKEKEISLDYVDGQNRTPLACLLNNKNFVNREAAIRYLLDQGADVSKKFKVAHKERTSRYSTGHLRTQSVTPLEFIAFLTNQEALDKFLRNRHIYTYSAPRHKFIPEEKDNRGDTSRIKEILTFYKNKKKKDDKGEDKNVASMKIITTKRATNSKKNNGCIIL